MASAARAEDSSSASVSGDFLFGDASIGDDASIEDGASIGDDASIEDGESIEDGTSGKNDENAALCLARNAALRLVSRAEQCTFLLSQKLLKRGFDAGVVKAVVRELAASNIVDDGRFSRLWLRSRIVAKADTPRRILMALRAKGIDRETAAAALEDCMDRETEMALLGRFVKKRFGAALFELSDYRAELRGEGFSQDEIRGFGETAEY